MRGEKRREEEERGPKEGRLPLRKRAAPLGGLVSAAAAVYRHVYATAPRRHASRAVKTVGMKIPNGQATPDRKLPPRAGGPACSAG